MLLERLKQVYFCMFFVEVQTIELELLLLILSVS